MNTRKTPEEMQKMSPEELIAEINRVDAEIQQDEKIQDAISGYIMSSWTPYGTGRKFVMFLLIVFGIIGLANGSYSALLLFFIAAWMSPRIVVHCAYALGRLASIFGGSK
jgi:hypothetical protein